MSAEEKLRIIKRILQDYYESFTPDERDSVEAGVLLAIDAVIGAEEKVER